MRCVFTSMLVIYKLLLVLAPTSAQTFDQPSPNAANIGDRLYPTLGNGGYDVRHYDLDLRYATSAPTQGIDGTVPIVVQVRHFTAHPSEPDPTTLLSTPFIVTPDGSVTAGQPNATHDFLPSNDHPRDKTTFTIRFDVPAGELAIANNERVAQYTAQ